jgi:hypothetical protein
MSCPNCGQKTHRGLSACALGVVFGLIEDRGDLDLDTMTPEVIAEIDVNEFWDRVRPLTAWVEEQLLAHGVEEVAAE